MIESEIDLRALYSIPHPKIPTLQAREPLKEELMHFVRCLQCDQEPLTNGKFATKVVEVLEKAQQSLDTGRKVMLK